MINLKAQEGYKYTQAEDVNIEDRIYASELCLGKFDSEDNWKLITDEEAEEGRRIQELKIREGMNEVI